MHKFALNVEKVHQKVPKFSLKKLPSLEKHPSFFTMKLLFIIASIIVVDVVDLVALPLTIGSLGDTVVRILTTLRVYSSVTVCWTPIVVTPRGPAPS